MPTSHPETAMWRSHLHDSYWKLLQHFWGTILRCFSQYLQAYQVCNHWRFIRTKPTVWPRYYTSKHLITCIAMHLPDISIHPKWESCPGSSPGLLSGNLGGSSVGGLSARQAPGVVVAVCRRGFESCLYPHDSTYLLYMHTTTYIYS